MNRPRIAIFSKIPIFPAYGGNRAHIRSMCENLRLLGCDISFYLIPSRQMREIDLESHYSYFGSDRMQVVQRSYLGMILDNLRIIKALIIGRLHGAIKRKNLLRNDVDYIYPFGITKYIKAISKKERFSIIIVQYVHFSKIFTEFDDTVYKVLQTHDSFHNEFTPKAETTGFLRAHKVLAIQEREANRFRSYLRGNDNKVQVLSHIIEQISPVGTGSNIGAAFIGSNMEANRISIDYFIEKILPIIIDKLPEFKLVVAGSICSYISDHKNIVKKGVVDDLRSVFKEAPILVNPIVNGTGIKIKLLDALGMGVAIVSTVFGVEGIDEIYLPGVSIVANDDPNGFAIATMKYYEQPKLCQEAGSLNASAAARWNNSQIEVLEKIISDLHIET